MKTFAIVAVFAVAASAFKITFQNNCSYAVWASIGKAHSRQVDPSLSYGAVLDPGASKSYAIDDYATGIRAWGTGCGSDGTSCAMSACHGGLVCNDAGITSHLAEMFMTLDLLLTENLTYWHLTQMDGTVNIPTTLMSSDGQSVKCTPSSCADDQAYRVRTKDKWVNFEAGRFSALGSTYTHMFC